MDGKIINGGGDSFRDASFSYLRSEHGVVPTQKSSASARTSFGADRNNNKKTEHLEGEISVFGAERYFNTPIGDDANDHPHDHDHEARAVNIDHRSVAMARPGTPSACSEISSWTAKSTAFLLKSNSVTAMRTPSHKSHHGAKRKLLRGSRTLLATLGCAGTCSDEKSVSVDHDRKAAEQRDHQQQQQQGQEANRLRYEARSTKRPEDHFAFPILNTTEENGTSSNDNITVGKRDEAGVDVGTTATVVVVDEPPRMSLEVFGSKASAKSGSVLDEVAMNLERKLSVLTWDAIPASKPYSNKVSPKSMGRPGNGRGGGGGDDLDSDASSDLFEIENITAGTRRGSEDAVSRCETPNNSPYEPSEASIEWSVVTASAVVDVGFEYDEKKLSANSKVPCHPKPPRRQGNGILGCKNQKSVRVVETAHRIN